ncbi:LOW QUALITY PROTEIN: hypothetical protein V1478_001896 [Vespula squamosa]|uniref:Uncharacterized protein n=1 Tax=Vespula squamosa TaxID=30214 RepID=A0ABD2BYF8_VESSQ
MKQIFLLSSSNKLIMNYAYNNTFNKFGNVKNLRQLSWPPMHQLTPRASMKVPIANSSKAPLPATRESPRPPITSISPVYEHSSLTCRNECYKETILCLVWLAVFAHHRKSLDKLYRYHWNLPRRREKRRKLILGNIKKASENSKQV